uniref:40S ribosomal protein S7 n=1 Tax=Trichuris muris TaxID=70415 RepID=A0A5S6QGF0_TRIMR
MSAVLYGKLYLKQRELPTKFEESVSQALMDLEASNEFKSHLKELHFLAAKEIEVPNRKAVIIYVPFPQLKQYRKIQGKLLRELEKKLGNRHVVIIARRRILPKPTRGKNRITLKQKRPRSRTLTSVHEEYLNDLVFPAEIVFLDRSQMTQVENKLDTFAGVYKHLTGRDVTFEFPEVLA